MKGGPPSREKLTSELRYVVADLAREGRLSPKVAADAVAERVGGRRAETQPPAHVRLPFPEPAGFVIPTWFPPEMSDRLLAAQLPRLDITRRRPTTRRSAAIVLGGLLGDERAREALVRVVHDDTDHYARSIALMSLALAGLVPADVMAEWALLFADQADDARISLRSKADQVELFAEAGTNVLLGAVAAAVTVGDNAQLERLQPLVRRIDHPDLMVRKAALQALLDRQVEPKAGPSGPG